MAVASRRFRSRSSLFAISSSIIEWLGAHLPWLGLLAICAGVIAMKQLQLQQYAAAKAAYASQLQAIAHADDRASAMIHSIISEDSRGSSLDEPGASAALRPDGPPVYYSKLELERLLNGGKPLAITRLGSNFVQASEGIRIPRRPLEYATWTYPGSSARYEFGFMGPVDGSPRLRWISFRKLPPAPPPPPPAIPLLVSRLDSIGRMFWAQIGPIVWLTCCVIAVALSLIAPGAAARAIASAGLLAAIVLCAAKYADVGLYGSRCFWPNDSICWGLLAVGISIEICFRCRDQQRNQRQSRGICVACGYNLTANISGTCPECGRKVMA